MSQYPPEKIYAAARTLLPTLEPDLRRQVEDLLAQAERGADTHLQLLDLLTQDDATRLPLRDLLHDEVEEESLMVDVEYSSPGGEMTSAEPGEVYVCPQCDFRYIIAEAGEQPPKCPKHKVALIPAREKKGG